MQNFTKVGNHRCVQNRLKILVSLLFLFVAVVVRADSDEPEHSPAEKLNPYAFVLSSAELKELAQQLSSKVDLFREVWAIHPTAEFYAGTTRDYLYWILGHFRNAKTSAQVSEVKQNLLALKFIQFREMVGHDSDADILVHDRNQLSGLSGGTFGIRKLDLIAYDQIDPQSDFGQSEFDQGFIPVEKLRLSKNGILEDSRFGNGVKELISGRLSMHFADPDKFWKTQYAKQGLNHPILLPIRYLRILAQDYLRRHGDDLPERSKLIDSIDPIVREKIKSIIRTALTDSRFESSLKLEKFRAWLNGPLQKSFRSYSNANAAFDLMKEMGVLRLAERYPEEIDSLHSHLLKIKRDPDKIRKNFEVYGVEPEIIYQKIDTVLQGQELIHGAGSEVAFRSIIFQGIVPSEYGSAGRGFYSVDYNGLAFAKNWSLTRAEVDDIVVAIKVNIKTKFIDITRGEGAKLFETWRNKNSNVDDAFDKFAEEFGADLIAYKYEDKLLKDGRAFVLKNAGVIESRRGIFKNPRPLRELISGAEQLNSQWKAKVSDIEEKFFSFFKDFALTPLMKSEREYVFSSLNSDLISKIWKLGSKRLYEKLGDSMPGWIEINLLAKPTEQVWDLWIEMLDLERESSEIEPYKSRYMKCLEAQRIWPEKVWKKIPDLIQANFFLTYRLNDVGPWPSIFWAEVPSLLDRSSSSHLYGLLVSLGHQKVWPNDFSQYFAQNMRRFADAGMYMDEAVGVALSGLDEWTPEIWKGIPDLMTAITSENLYLDSINLLKRHNQWPDFFWKEIPKIFEKLNQHNMIAILSVLKSRADHDPRICQKTIERLTNIYHGFKT